MQSLEVISVNLWHIVASLLNLLLLYLMIKKFFYRPVKNMLEQRQNSLNSRYQKAEEALKQAQGDQRLYREKLSLAEKEADAIIQNAVRNASYREKEILENAKCEADGIVRQAEENAALELKKAEKQIRDEIVSVSAALSEKILEREVSPSDQTNLIDSLIREMEEPHEAHRS